MATLLTVKLDGDMPEPLVFRCANQLPAHAVWPLHTHGAGEFVYSFSGVMEIHAGGTRLLAPPQYGVWLPPDVAHIGLNRTSASHASLYVARPLCAALPTHACALALSPLILSLLEHLRSHAVHRDAAARQRLLQVLLDELCHAPCAGSYLPSSSDPPLARLLAWLEAHPDEPRTLAALARQVNSSERTLMRRAQRDLGMPLSEWRQRLCTLQAMPLLAAGHTVESVALALGYASASAFIVMFRQRMGLTPAEFAASSRRGT
jgi:AraC-like DNA-binding protein